MVLGIQTLSLMPVWQVLYQPRHLLTSDTFSQPSPLSDGLRKAGVRKEMCAGYPEKPVTVLFVKSSLYSFSFRIQLNPLTAAVSDGAGILRQSKVMARL